MPRARALIRLTRALAAASAIAAAAGAALADPAGPPPSERLPTHGVPRWFDVDEVVFAAALAVVVAFLLRHRGALRRARTAGEARFRDLVEAAPFGIIVHRRGRADFINRSGRRTLGLPGDAPLDGPALTGLLPALAAAAGPAPPADPAAADGSRRVRIRGAEGASIDLSLVSNDTMFDGQRVHLTFFRDVTAELEAQRALAESRELLSVALEAARDGVWDLDLAAGRLTGSNAFAGILDPGGPPPADPAAWRALVHPADRAQLEEAIAAHDRDGTASYQCEMRIRRKDGGYAWVLEHGRIVERDDDGRARRFAGTIRDVSARKRAEGRLEVRGRLAAAFLGSRGNDLREALGALLQDILESPCSCVGVLDATGRLRLAHDAGSAAGVSHALLAADEVPASLRRVLAAAGPLELDDTGTDPAAPQGPLLGAPLVSGDRVLGLVAVGGRAEGYRPEDAETLAGIAADLAPLFQAHLETEAKDAQLSQAQKMEALGVLAGGIAHDFNNILQAILGFSTLARQDADDPERLAADLDRVQRATERGRDLVQRILQFSRPGEPEAPPMDPAPLVTDLVRELQATLPGRISVEGRVAEDCGRVRAAPELLRQALVNLAQNASQALDAVGGTLTVAARPWTIPAGDGRLPPEWHGRPVVEFVIADTGPGIPEVHRARLFDPFFTTREVGQGSGLGLSVVHGLVTGLGGRVTIECPAGGGTVASVYLSRVDAQGRAAVDEPLPACPGPGAPRIRVLFVDDEPEIRELAATLLVRAGFEVELAPDGQAAYERLAARPDACDVLITDQYMPGLTGRELARRVATLRPGLPVILVSGLGEPAEPEPAGGFAFREVVTKPFLGQTLSLAVHRALANSPGAGPAGWPPLDSAG